ncbi:glycerol-3-phosphate phosphatase [Microcaecilia unicolor]|uniref:Glycerol-3-phosphate phosphatase n=1 Tax=Microcaecilia unicolor TaxID=1415580 RepID=A0A6P7YX24_9AMPH|nr:glycerol-3-phosphate phosphatase [Microcaecilia unicolor]
MAAAARCLPLAGSCAAELLSSVDTLLFDCDGVIWRGEQAVPGAAEVLSALRRSGKRVFFLTNNSTKTRAMYAAKLGRLGLGADEREVFGTAYCTALYLRKVAGLRGKVYLIGGQALSQELQAAGIPHLGSGPDPVRGGVSDWAAQALDPDVRAVVVGFDEHFSYMKLNKALGYLRDSSCLFLATNTDTRLPLEGGLAIPGTGCLVKAVETAAHRQAQIIGKPSRFLYECVAAENEVDPTRTVMVGDRLDTDILMGFNCGLKTILTLTGFSSLEEAKSYQGSDCPTKRSMVPDYYVQSIADLLPALQA